MPNTFKNALKSLTPQQYPSISILERARIKKLGVNNNGVRNEWKNEETSYNNHVS